MSAVGPPVVCKRVREHVSLQLDGDLSELERRMMESHLARCPECHAFERDTAEFTQLLRDAPLESSRYPVVVHRPRRLPVAGMQVGVAAALAVAVLGVALQITGPESQRSSTLPSLEAPVRVETYNELAREVQQIVAAHRPYNQQRTQRDAIPI